MTLIQGACLVCLLSACASQRASSPLYDAARWTGTSQQALLKAWGPPTVSRTLPDGSTQLQYVTPVTRPFPGPSFNSPGVIVAGSKTIGYQIGTGNNMSQYVVHCVTVFQIGTDRIVKSAKQQGAGCQS